MTQRRKRTHSPEYQAALKVILEQGFYVLQKRQKKTGQWQTEGDALRGKDAAYDALKAAKATDRFNYEWRVVQDMMAQAYQDGWTDRDDFATGTYTPYDEIQPAEAVS